MIFIVISLIFHDTSTKTGRTTIDYSQSSYVKKVTTAFTTVKLW